MNELYKWLDDLQKQGFESIIIIEVLNKIAQIQRNNRVRRGLAVRRKQNS
uniref:GTP-binding controlling metal-binding protein n=1 Tax=virus sp. ctd0M1 TaxID=2827993 RepID=A0A8S5RDK1_9VIRU|nr:MAG TPA: Putative GTP-binding controlling metal-binding protein [virus sp. ctd0M1]